MAGARKNMVALNDEPYVGTPIPSPSLEDTETMEIDDSPRRPEFTRTGTMIYHSDDELVSEVMKPKNKKKKQPVGPKRFRINAVNVFLTYPKCPLDKEEVLELILDKFTLIRYVVVAKETHEDGSPHIHVQIQFEKKKDFRKADFADLWGFDDYNNLTTYHGNYQPTRSIKSVARYCTKESDFILHGLTLEEFYQMSGKRNYFAAALHAENYVEACKIVKGGAPRDWVLSGDRIRANLKINFNAKLKEYAPMFDTLPFKPPTELKNWVSSWTTSRTPCLCLIGPSKLGKTAWARSIVQPHMYWKGLINIDDWNPEAKLIIFDDFDWQFLPQPKILLTQAGDGTITDRYRHKTNIHVSMPAILLCNNMPCLKDGLPLNMDDYWKENMVFVTIYNKLY